MVPFQILWNSLAIGLGVFLQGGVSMSVLFPISFWIIMPFYHFYLFCMKNWSRSHKEWSDPYRHKSLRLRGEMLFIYQGKTFCKSLFHNCDSIHFLFSYSVPHLHLSASWLHDVNLSVINRSRCAYHSIQASPITYQKPAITAQTHHELSNESYDPCTFKSTFPYPMV